jgi:hypothetical protein
LRWISYPVTPTLSVDATQDSATRLELSATAFRSVGVLGASVSGGGGGGPPAVTTSSGRLPAASRALKSTPSEEVPARRRLTVPLPVTNGVTSYSTHVLTAIAPLSSRAALVGAGLLAHVRPVSVHPVPVA